MGELLYSASFVLATDFRACLIGPYAESNYGFSARRLFAW